MGFWDVFPMLASLAIALIGLSLQSRAQKIGVAVLAILVLWGQINDRLESREQQLQLNNQSARLNDEIVRQRKELRGLRREVRQHRDYVNGQASVLAQLSDRTYLAVIGSPSAEPRERAAQLSSAILAHAAECEAKQRQQEDAGVKRTIELTQECLAIFSERYAGPALAVFNELVRMGVPDATGQALVPFEHAVRFPTNLFGIREVGTTLGAMSSGSLGAKIGELEAWRAAQEAKQADRQLTPEQSKALSECLAGLRGREIAIRTPLGCDECERLADRIGNALRGAGLTTDTASSPLKGEGLVVENSLEAADQNLGKYLSGCLGNAGLGFIVVRPREQVAPGSMTLLVGRRRIKEPEASAGE